MEIRFPKNNLIQFGWYSDSSTYFLSCSIIYDQARDAITDCRHSSLKIYIQISLGDQFAVTIIAFTWILDLYARARTCQPSHPLKSQLVEI